MTNLRRAYTGSDRKQQKPSPRQSFQYSIPIILCLAQDKPWLLSTSWQTTTRSAMIMSTMTIEKSETPQQTASAPARGIWNTHTALGFVLMTLIWGSFSIAVKIGVA